MLEFYNVLFSFSFFLVIHYNKIYSLQKSITLRFGEFLSPIHQNNVKCVWFCSKGKYIIHFLQSSGRLLLRSELVGSKKRMVLFALLY